MGSRGPVNDHGGVALQQRNDSIITAVIISKEVLPSFKAFQGHDPYLSRLKFMVHAPEGLR